MVAGLAAQLEIEPPSLGDGPEPVDRLGGQDGEVDRLGVGRLLRRVEPGEPEEVLDQPAHPLVLDVDLAERGAVPLGVAVLGQGQARVRLDDRQRRPQLVRRVGGELELADAGLLDRRGDPPSDRHGSEEDDDEQDRGDDQLGQQEGRPRLVDRGGRLADHDVARLASRHP